jgi:hypothetical protein
LHHVVWYKFTDVSEVLDASIIRAMSALMMEAASTSETLVNFYQTRQHNNPEDSHLHTHHCENIKSHKQMFHLRPQMWVSAHCLETNADRFKD